MVVDLVQNGKAVHGAVRHLILEEIAVENKDKVKIYKMNIDDNPGDTTKYGIRVFLQ
ncbi:MAG: hypothetical protein CM15mP31_4220 [Gammaproteobacteria bacterium]|nr:MAG: hypothetical protein CM15mP31_4220 [Gammaproteobacteria bacterium]